jgi:hypothetical protein
MLNLSFFSWLQYVNKLFIREGIVSGLLSPTYKKGIQKTGTPVENISFTHISFPSHLIVFSTRFLYSFYLLFLYYPHNPQHLLLTQQNKI